jgi:pimeloyl-ACP methyl ester carboxylesterase
MGRSDTLHPAAVEKNSGTPSTEAWFAGGERFGYDPKAAAIVASAPLKVFLKCEGDLAHAVSFVPGYPDGSFGWAKVLPYLPNAAAMPKLFVEYVGMGDSDKPKDYAYSTAERTDLVEAVWRDLSVKSTTLVAFDFSSLVVLEHLRRRLERAERGQPMGGPHIRGVFISMAGSLRTGTPTLGTQRRFCAASLTELARVWGALSHCSRCWRG